MELLLNEEAVGSEQPKNRVEGAQLIAKGVATLLFAFFVSRVSFFYFMYPCGIALLTVLLNKGKWNIYALPMVLLGICTGRGIMTYLWGDLLAAVLCALLFFFWKKCSLSLVQRGALAALITGAAKLAWGMQSHIFYLYDGAMILGECLLIFIFIYFFDGIPFRRTAPENIAALVAVALLLTKGIFPVYVGALAPAYITGMFFTLLIGYYLGPLEGAEAGIIAGLVLIGISGSVPSIGHIMACGGMVAGALGREKRWVSAACFVGVLLSFGALRGYPNLYMNVYEPVLAAAAFVCIPQKVMARGHIFWSSVGQRGVGEEVDAKAAIKVQLERYKETFSYLARAYGRRYGEENYPYRDKSEQQGVRLALNSRAVLTSQFKGMAKAIDGIVAELERPVRPAELRTPRYELRLGVSGYAKEGGVSGDSYLCTELRKGEYMMVLSDGMGKGQKAAEESVLTVNTLHQLLRAGFEAELALNIINSVLLVKSTEEIFSTVDLSLINLYSGRMKLYKIGAAASFIKRGTAVQMVKVATLPVGIVDRIPIECLEVGVRKGDQIITVSDGITEANPSDPELGWLREAISLMTTQDAQTIADRIINLAVQQWGIRERDDMTVLVVSVE